MGLATAMSLQPIPCTESNIAARLRPILAALPCDTTIGNPPERHDVLASLEYFVEQVLREVHPEWRHESLDGILPEVMRKTSDNELELAGMCILISDQTLTPLYLRLQLDTVEDAISWFECRLGEATAEGMRRTPYSVGSNSMGKTAVWARLDRIRWVYRVGYGKRRHASRGDTLKDRRRMA
jgi:hypothetical protein